MARPKTGRKPLTTAHVGLMTEEQRMKLRVIPTARRVEVWMKEADQILNPPKYNVQRNRYDMPMIILPTRDDDLAVVLDRDVLFVGYERNEVDGGLALDHELAARLIPLLERFVATGTIEEAK